MRKPIIIRAAIAASAVLALAACSSGKKDWHDESAANLPPTLPVSLNAVMVGMVDDSSDYLFALGNGDMPKNDHDWNLVRNSAYRTIVAGKVIQLAGTGPEDMAWSRDPEWIAMADELTAIGMDALAKAEAKDPEGWAPIGDRLVQNCLACHEKYKPEIPTQGIMHESTKAESEGKSVFN